jgi:LysM repeat protein
MRFRNRFVLLMALLALALAGCFQQAGTALQEPIVSNQQVVATPTSVTLPTEVDNGAGSTATSSTDNGHGQPLSTPTFNTLPDTSSTETLSTDTTNTVDNSGNTDTTNPPVAITIISATLPPIATETPLELPTEVNGQTTETQGSATQSQFITPSGPLGPITQVPVQVTTNAGEPAATPSGLVTPTAFSPVDTEGTCTHTVQSGDTLYRIALKYQVTVADLKNANPQLVGDIIQPGDVLKVPNCNSTGGNTGTNASQPTAETLSPATALPSGSQTYVVKRGDTLYTIGLKFGVTADAIQKANNISNPNLIKPDQTLIIPAKSG